MRIFGRTWDCGCPDRVEESGSNNPLYYWFIFWPIHHGPVRIVRDTEVTYTKSKGTNWADTAKDNRIIRALRLGRLQVELHTHSAGGWGRFGGGWQWKLGIQASEGFRTTIINLVVCDLCIYWGKEE